ncbi:CRE-GEM-4 protein [Caenorhabditis remanei]|uniref:Nicotinic receptor-associated protein 1 n=1 Tax=Caenorhabditis remanei TaxID=31234 RepID=E3M7V0_CAERE|nr:CRE-GEM-4 protein [Caenorhabditis remanei]
MNQPSALGLNESRPKTNVRLTISAKFVYFSHLKFHDFHTYSNLMDLDVFSVSDPICIIYEKTSGRKSTTTDPITLPTWRDRQWTERGRTEIVWNNLNPQFKTTFLLPYFFEETQLLRFELYDVDSKVVGTDLTAHDFLGRFECVLAQIVSYSTFRAHLGDKEQIGSQVKPKSVLDFENSFKFISTFRDKNSKNGTITIRAEEDEKNEKIQFDVCGEGLDRKDFFGKSDPYLNFKRRFDDGSSHLIHQTEVKPRNLNPRWATVQINTQALCGKNLDRPILIECFDHEKFKKQDDIIGTSQTTLNELLTEGGKTGSTLQIPLINEKKKTKKSKYRNSGILKIWNAKIIIEPTFLDFISGGTQLDFSVAVDFTASNGNPSTPSSLHYMASGVPNQYEIALRAVLSICQHYNSSKTFEAYGFGAKLPGHHLVSAVFPLDLQSKNSSVVGINGVMHAYRHALQNVSLYGPTNFSPIIEQVAKKAQKMINSTARYQVIKIKRSFNRFSKSNLQILLIITDGIISDMYATINTVISASGLPLSIIIIGVGNEDFERMHELDSDDALLQQDSRIAQRDIVQFVTMRDFLSRTNGGYLDADTVMENLAREVLYEVPAQLTGYMKQRGFTPRTSDDPWQRDSPPDEYDPRMDNIHNIRASAPPLYPQVN